MAVAPAGLLVIAFPGGSGTASLLHQAHRLQGLSSLPIELIDLAIASGGRAPPRSSISSARRGLCHRFRPGPPAHR
jgi:hypothetical protein